VGHANYRFFFSLILAAFAHGALMLIVDLSLYCKTIDDKSFLY